jgi:hypothetical protein
MQTYRFFAVNALGKVVEELETPCANDAEARAIARMRGGGGLDVEVWDVGRRVPVHGDAPARRPERVARAI